MPQATGSFSSYDAVGNREDLSNVIYDVSPAETPVLSAIGKKKARATYHEWQTDALASAASNAHIEGDDATPSAPSATTRLGNYTQIMKKHSVVTGTQEAVDKAGRKSEMAYQIEKRMKEIKKDMEYAFIGVNNARVAGNDSTAREMGSITTYLTSNTVFNSGGTPAGADATGDGSDARTDSGTQQAFTEAMLTQGLQAAYTSGGNPTLLVAGTFNRGEISDFAGGSTRYVTTDKKKLTHSIDVYEGDFHKLTVVPCRQVRARDVLAIDPEHLAIAELRPLQSYDLAKTGDSWRKEMTWEATLEVSNEAAHVGIFDLTTS